MTVAVSVFVLATDTERKTTECQIQCRDGRFIQIVIDCQRLAGTGDRLLNAIQMLLRTLMEQIERILRIVQM